MKPSNDAKEKPPRTPKDKNPLFVQYDHKRQQLKITTSTIVAICVFGLLFAVTATTVVVLAMKSGKP